MAETANETAGLGALWREAWDLWLAGGWAMIGIAAIALVMFALGLHVHLRLRAKGFRSVPERAWRRWIDHPAEREGPIGELLDFVGGSRSLADTTCFFEQVRTVETAPFVRDLRMMKICVGAAPLVGLLGTVTGMLTTFGALATGSGGAKTMGMIADGISEALITTETGLVVALPGLYFQHMLARNFERYKAFLAHLETVCAQERYRRTRKRELRNTRQAALRQVARLLHGAAS
jgi:biopolymer transport protein ExbB